VYISRLKSPAMWRRVVRRTISDVSNARIAAIVFDPWPRRERHYHHHSKRRKLLVQRHIFVLHKARVFGDTALITWYVICVSFTSNSFFALKELVFPASHKLDGCHSGRCAVGVSVCLTEPFRCSGDWSKLHQLQSRPEICLSYPRVL
jgi:hypothetical protein